MKSEFKKLLTVLLFIGFGLIAIHFPISALAGSKVKFTVFDLAAPAFGAYLGMGFGIVTVFLVQLFNLVSSGLEGFDKGVIVRLFPTLFAVWYFSLQFSNKSSSKVRSYDTNKLILMVPILSILIFNLHPVGRSVWFYSLFWLIPILAWPFRTNFLLLRALGATFCAHSVGGAIWIWVFNLPAAVWIGLIPTVILERIIFAFGISAFYILANNVLAWIYTRVGLIKIFSLDKRYLLKFLR